MAEENTKQSIPGLPDAIVRDDAKTVLFHMQKDRLFRTVHADGVWCSPAPRGLVHLMFYHERLPVPERTYFDLVDGLIGDEQLERRVIKEGYIREVEVAAVLDRNALTALHNWIGGYLERTKLEPNNVSPPV